MQGAAPSCRSMSATTDTILWVRGVYYQVGVHCAGKGGGQPYGGSGGAAGEVSQKISSTNVDTPYVCARCLAHAGFFTRRVVPCSGEAHTAGRISVLVIAGDEVHNRNPLYLPTSGTRIEQRVFC